MPLITARQTIIQAASSDRVILQFRPPLSAIVLVMFRVSRYQKYVVAELFSHSGSTTNQTKENQRDKIKPMSINIALTIWWLCGKHQIVFLRIWFWFIRLPIYIDLIPVHFSSDFAYILNERNSLSSNAVYYTGQHLSKPTCKSDL